MLLRIVFAGSLVLGLTLGPAPALQAGELSFDSLAFVPAVGDGPKLQLPQYPALHWTRVAFQPRMTNNFPEELKPLRILTAPAASITSLAVAGDDLWALSPETGKVYLLNATTGAALDSFPAQGGCPSGLCWDGQVLWQTDLADSHVYALDRSGKVLKEFPVGFQPRAILRGPDELLVSDWAKATFHRLDPETGKELGTSPAPDDKLTGLTMAGGRLWCSRGDEILCFDQTRGLPVCGFNATLAGASAFTVAGLTADGKTLWFANSAGNKIEQIALPTNGQWIASSGRLRQHIFEMSYSNNSDRPVDSFTALQNVPYFEMPGQRYVALDVQPPPQAYFRDDLGNITALVNFGRLEAGQTAHCRIAATLWVADRRMVVDPDLITNSFTPAEAAYAHDFHGIEGADDPLVKSFVAEAEAGETNLYWQVRRAHDALCHAVYYREGGTESVADVLRKGYGVCRNYSAAMESFGRVLGVPMLDAWAPRHETTFLMLPGLTPAIMEVTEDALSTNTAPTWERSRWFLGAPAKEITTGVRGFAMHTRVLVDGTPFAYQWHCWLPDAVHDIRARGVWTVINPSTGQTRRM
jgi:transglutaminase-like putative cysteine protease/sugar lactone lactonase YvrE